MEKVNNMLLDILVFLLTISYCTGTFYVLYRYIILPFGSYYVYTVHIYVHTLLSNDESVVSPTRRAQQLEQTCLTIYLFFFLFWCGFILHLFLVVRVGFPLLNHYLHVLWFSFLFGHCIAFPSIYDFGLPL